MRVLALCGGDDHVLRLIEDFEDEQHLYIVLEYCPGGELFSCGARTGGVEYCPAGRGHGRAVWSPLIVCPRAVGDRGIEEEEAKRMFLQMARGASWPAAAVAAVTVNARLVQGLSSCTPAGMLTGTCRWRTC